MACNSSAHSCDPAESFHASYCDDCERWIFRARRHHVLLAAGVLAAAAVVVGVAILQPELIAPLVAVAGGGVAKRALAFLV